MKRQYIKPAIIRISLDNSISLQMQTGPPVIPDPRSQKKGTNEPFESPFGDKPFS